MNMKVFYLFAVVKFIKEFEDKDRARLERTRQFFENRGFQIGPKYIKKIANNIWELRAGKIRLFLCVKGEIAYGVHIMYKKSQKLPQRDLKLAIKRCGVI